MKLVRRLEISRNHLISLLHNLIIKEKIKSRKILISGANFEKF